MRLYHSPLGLVLTPEIVEGVGLGNASQLTTFELANRRDLVPLLEQVGFRPAGPTRERDHGVLRSRLRLAAGRH
jgi:hypothetical protein